MTMKKVKDCDYADMTKIVGGQSEPSLTWDPPMRNTYENTRKAENNWNWSGTDTGLE
jgi:hypothetical protein